MKVGVLSDTHDRTDTIDTAYQFFKQQAVDTIIHCGDWKSVATFHYIVQAARKAQIPLIGVVGNNDNARQLLEEANDVGEDVHLYEGAVLLTLDNAIFRIYHGHHPPTLRRLLNTPDSDYLLLGHSHKPFIRQEETRVVINPGSTAFAIPRRKDWLPSVAMIDTSTKTMFLTYLKR